MRNQLCSLLIVALFAYSHAHGGMTNPPARNTLQSTWQYNGVDWQSGSAGTNSNFQGGWSHNQVQSVCGAPSWDRPGPIVATFTAGQTISIELTITAPHAGYSEFRLCPSAPSSKNQLVSCLLKSPPLKRSSALPSGSRSKYPDTAPTWTTENLQTRWRAPSLDSNPQNLYSQDGQYTGKTYKGFPVFRLSYVLPAGVTCNHCILQWFYQSTNSANGGGNTLESVKGERFFNCADIRITGGSGGSTPNPKTPKPTPQSIKSTVRCGADWSAANNGCDNACTSDAQCPRGQQCYKDLVERTCPIIASAIGDNTPDNNVTPVSTSLEGYQIALVVIGALLLVSVLVLTVAVFLVARRIRQQRV